MKTLLLLHGWGASGAVWRRQEEAFQDRFQVLTPTIPAWDAAWLGRYLEALPLSETLVAGWSLGGMLLLGALALPGVPPPAGWALVGAAASFCRRPNYPWGQPAAAVRAMRRGLQDRPEEVRRAFARQCLAPGETAWENEALALLAISPSADTLAPGLDYLLYEDHRSLLERLSPGAAIIQGDQDAIVPPAQAEFLRAHLPGSRLYLLPGAGHLPFLTQAGRFNAILAKLLDVEK